MVFYKFKLRITRVYLYLINNLYINFILINYIIYNRRIRFLMTILVKYLVKLNYNNYFIDKKFLLFK